MTRKEIEAKAEEVIEAKCKESGCIREEVVVPSMHCFVEQYIHGQITQKDLFLFSQYLGMTLNMGIIEHLKERVKLRQA